MGALQPNSGAGKDRYIKQLEKQNDELKDNLSKMTGMWTSLALDNGELTTKLHDEKIKSSELLQMVKKLTEMAMEL